MISVRSRYRVLRSRFRRTAADRADRLKNLHCELAELESELGSVGESIAARAVWRGNHGGETICAGWLQMESDAAARSQDVLRRLEERQEELLSQLETVKGEINRVADEAVRALKALDVLSGAVSDKGNKTN